MIYKKIKVMSTDDSKRFYRTMYVRSDLNLFQLGVTILSAFNCMFYHMFLFTDKRRSYIDSSWLEDDFAVYSPIWEKSMDYEKCTVKDLTLESNNTFRLCYDTGDNWEFDIKVYKVEKDFDDDFFGRIINGKGHATATCSNISSLFIVSVFPFSSCTFICSAIARDRRAHV